MSIEINTSLLERGIDANKTNKVSSLQFQIDQILPVHSAGKIIYDPTSKSFIFDTGYADVRANIPFEQFVEVYNDTASPIINGDPVSVNLVFTGGIPNAVPVDPNVIELVLGFAGVATMDIPMGEKGVVTTYGTVRGVDTSLLIEGFIYAAVGGGYTQVRPKYPTERLLVGAVSVVDAVDGEILVASQHIPRRSASRGYTFTSSDAAAGVHYRAGSYDWETASIPLTEASPSINIGTANVTKAAHIGIVPSGPGLVDAGQVGLQVTGTLDSETGVQTAAQTAIITEDITTLSIDEMTECIEKFSGSVLLELYVVSGTPTAYSLTFNAGSSKYEDFANIDGTVTGFSAVWEAGANDTGFNIELLHHKKEGWTYAATGFVPGDSAICERSVDQAIANSLAIGEAGAYKRVSLDTFIDGSSTEGIIIRVTTDANNSIRSMDMSVVAFSEEIS